MFLKFDEAVLFLKEHGFTMENPEIIWGTIRTGGTGNAYFLLTFTSEEIIIIGVSAMGKPDEILEVIPVANVTKCSFKKKLLFGYRLQIETENQVYTFHVNKSMVGTKWHKESFDRLTSSSYTYITNDK